MWLTIFLQALLKASLELVAKHALAALCRVGGQYTRPYKLGVSRNMRVFLAYFDLGYKGIDFVGVCLSPEDAFKLLYDKGLPELMRDAHIQEAELGVATSLSCKDWASNHVWDHVRQKLGLAHGDFREPLI